MASSTFTKIQKKKLLLVTLSAKSGNKYQDIVFVFAAQLATCVSPAKEGLPWC